MIRLIRRERETLASLATIGVSSRKAVDLLTDIGTEEDSDSGADEAEGVFDIRDKSEDGSLVVWMNDLETDQRYKDWSPNLIQILQPTYGQFHQVRRNLVSALFAFDLSAPRAMETISFEAANYVQRFVPFRFGVLPLVHSDDGDGEFACK